MANLQEMLKSAHVEWKKLGEVCEISSGGDVPKHAFSKQKSDKYSIPVVSNGTGENSLYGYTSTAKITQHAVTVSARGTIGYVAYRDYPYYPIVRLLSLIPKLEGKLEAKYLYYCLSNREFLTPTTGIPQLTIPMIKDESIPIPPIEVQIEIVRILDAFNTLTEELLKKLATELTLRKKQYAYYLEKLLSEEGLKKCARVLGEDDSIRWETLGEVGKFIRGNGLQKKDFRKIGKPVLHYGQIHTTYGFSTNSTISYTEEKIFEKLRKAKKNDILMATTSENAKDVAKCVVWLGDEEIGFSGDMYAYRTCENAKYVAYFFQSDAFQNQKNKKVFGTKVMRINSADMEKFTIPIPSLTVQEYVVGMLDKFSALIAETEGALPAEIAMRKKQYEYYRDALLKFEK